MRRGDILGHSGGARGVRLRHRPRDAGDRSPCHSLRREFSGGPVLLADVNSTYTSVVTNVFSTTIAAKVWFATGAVVLALVQIATAARLWGYMQPIVRLSTATVRRVHRWSGRLAFLFTLPVVFHCVFILGFQTGNARVAIHSIVGSFFYGVFAVKVLFVRHHHSYPSWILPLAGGTLFALLGTLWITSSFWYFSNIRVGF
jgi:Family of unknown function (DUF6529)